MIKRFEGHACCHRTVTDYRYHLPVAMLFFRSHHHAERCADRCAGMTYAKSIVFAFLATVECCESAGLAHGQHAFATAGQNFMWITLMPHIPDQPIFWCIEHVVQGNGEFYDSETRTEMATGFAYSEQQKFAQLLCEFRQLASVEITQVMGTVD